MEPSVAKKVGSWTAVWVILMLALQKYTFTGGGGDGVGVEVGTELGNMRKWQFLEKLHF